MVIFFATREPGSLYSPRYFISRRFIDGYHVNVCRNPESFTEANPPEFTGYSSPGLGSWGSGLSDPRRRAEPRVCDHYANQHGGMRPRVEAGQQICRRGFSGGLGRADGCQAEPDRQCLLPDRRSFRSRSPTFKLERGSGFINFCCLLS
jgi:hypothetical protein